MSVTVSEKNLQDFLTVLTQACSGEDTTGLFVYMLASRRGGLELEAVLASGKLPLEFADRIAEQSRAKLMEHNREERA